MQTEADTWFADLVSSFMLNEETSHKLVLDSGDSEILIVSLENETKGHRRCL